jgi:uncharacterized membrane protein
MDPTTKSNLLWVIAGLLGITTIGLSVFGFVLIKGGAYPPEGSGSLGHVGMVVAGIIAEFLGLILCGLMLVCIARARVVTSDAKPATDADPPE